MIDVESPRGVPVTFHHRELTSDGSIIAGTFRLWGTLDDEYGLADLYPRTFLDIGGHIGTVTVAVLVDNPDCRAVILEPLPENIVQINLNLESAGVADRATVIHGAIGSGSEARIGYRLPHNPAATDGDHWVGAPVADDFAGPSVLAPVYPLGDLLDLLGDEVDLAKIDCEGCEYTAFESPDVGRVKTWIGEWHAGGTLFGLAATHHIEASPHDDGITGTFSAVLR